MTTYRKDPTLYGDNVLGDAFSTASTVTIGSGVGDWRDNTVDGSCNCIISQSSDYSSTGDNSVKMVGAGTGANKTSFVNLSLVVGTEYELSFKMLIPTVPSTAEPTAYWVAVGSTLFNNDYAYSDVIGVDATNMIEGQWVQAHSLIWTATAVGAYFTIGMIANNSGDIMFLDEIYLRKEKMTYTADADPT
tara:strand:+ start:12374 stop:12943 length:570 start_codon:yes stop_codon:yes gene_type:complete